MVKILKHILLAGIVTSVFMMSGCDLLTREDDAAAAEITISPDTETEVTVGDILEISGTVTASGELILGYELTDDKEDSTGIGDKILVNKDKSATPSDLKERDLRDEEDLKIIVSAAIGNTACAGDYILIIKAGVQTSDEEVEVAETKKFEFTVVGPECDNKGLIIADVEVVADNMGAQTADSGSSIDLDEFKVWTRANAKINAAKVDLFMGFLSGTVQLMSPEEAANWPILLPAEEKDDWDPSKTNATKFYLTTVSDDFDNIKSQYQIDALWDESMVDDDIISTNDGKVFIAKTDQEKITLLRVVGIKSGSGTSTVIDVEGYVAK